MTKRVRLRRLVDGMEVQSEEVHAYLDAHTGEVVHITDDALGYAEREPKDLRGAPRWQREAAEFARKVVDEDEYLELPSKEDIQEYDLMKQFCAYEVTGPVQAELRDTIRRRGTSQRFKETLRRLGLEEQWQQYKDETLRGIAVDWCREHNVPFVDDVFS